MTTFLAGFIFGAVLASAIWLILLHEVAARYFEASHDARWWESYSDRLHQLIDGPRSSAKVINLDDYRRGAHDGDAA